MTIEQQRDALVEELSTLVNRKGNHLDGWFSDTVNALLEGKIVDNICIDGEWKCMRYDGKQLVIVK